MRYSTIIKGYYYRNDPLNTGADSILLFDEKCAKVAGIVYLKPDSALSQACWDENGIPALCCRYSELLPLIDVLSGDTDVYLDAEINADCVESVSLAIEGHAKLSGAFFA
ncbi:MAG: hypothetical protein J7539_12265 [Niabella sp.]|nr:hypothetical protein [Niabella sp.]